MLDRLGLCGERVKCRMQYILLGGKERTARIEISEERDNRGIESEIYNMTVIILKDVPALGNVGWHGRRLFGQQASLSGWGITKRKE